MKIENDDGQFVCLLDVERKQRYMRLTCVELKEIAQKDNGPDHIWYAMRPTSWNVVDEPQELEAKYQELLKEQACKLN